MTIKCKKQKKNLIFNFSFAEVFELQPPLKKQNETPKIVGLKNLNNYCYANVVTQMLFSLNDIRDFILNMQDDDKPFVGAIQEVFQKLSMGKVFDIGKIVELLGWENGKHHDAAEFFYYINLKLDEESDELLDLLSASFQLMSKKGMSRSLTFSTSSYKTLEEAFADEPDIIFLPKRVFINLDRVHEKGSSRSSSKFVFPMEFRANRMMTDAEEIYSLKAVISHCGTALNGQYQIVINQKSVWYKISDTEIEIFEVENFQEQFGGKSFIATSLLYEMNGTNVSL